MSIKRLKTRELIKWTPVLSPQYTNLVFTLEPFMVANVKEKKSLSEIVSQLQSLYPLDDRIKFKRVRKLDNEKAPSFQVLLCPKQYYKGLPDGLSQKLDDVREVELPADPILTRAQYDLTTKNYWPLQFHLDKHVESLLDRSFMTKNPDLMLNYDMFTRIALDLAKFFNTHSAALVVDLKTNSIVTCGIDSRCINPLNHSTMDAIKNVANRQLSEIHNNTSYSNDLLNEFLKSIEEKDSIEYAETLRIDLAKQLDKNDYLCTNYGIFLTHEPCSMCSMSLVHSRISKVFYVFNTKYGYLRSKFQLNLVKSLNHSYEVYEAEDFYSDDKSYEYFSLESSRHPNFTNKTNTK